MAAESRLVVCEAVACVLFHACLDTRRQIVDYAGRALQIYIVRRVAPFVRHQDCISRQDERRSLSSRSRWLGRRSRRRLESHCGRPIASLDVVARPKEVTAPFRFVECDAVARVRILT